MVIWCHGYEILRWDCDYYSYTLEQIEKERESLERIDMEKVVLFQKLFARGNVWFIFVSNWLKERVYESIGTLPCNYKIIHNYIDEDLYVYHKKNPEDRKRILSIKSHNTKTYANDIVAKAIIELAHRDIFKELTFELYGEGKLFEENFGELLKRDYPNVIINRRILSQKEMAEKFNKFGVFLSPTRRDTQGVTQGEAMSAGLTVISCRTSAIPEFIDNDSGCLYEFDNYFQMANLIEFLFYHPEEFLRKSENASMRVRKQCGYDTTINKEIKLIKEI